MPIPEQNKKAQGAKNIPYWTDLLIRNGVKPDTVPFVLSQIILESDWFTSNAYIFDKNPAGITWNDNYKTRPGATIGRKRPSKEGGNYVHFNTFNDAAKDLVRILSKQLPGNQLGRPIDSTNNIDYAQRLKANGYYASSYNDYLGGLEAQLKRIKSWFDISSLIKKKRLNWLFRWF
jgi:hypothetical protein